MSLHGMFFNGPNYIGFIIVGGALTSRFAPAFTLSAITSQKIRHAIEITGALPSELDG
jgi:hypothetical protein